MKKFNTTGACKPAYHYMVDIQNRLEQIKVLIDEGEYFVVFMDFQRQMSTKKYKDETIFSIAFAEAFMDSAMEL